ncbi:KIF3A [Mytilus edulis]|uniref:KIF3A n=1 Tax=Mytilus edulis TaxID=6550 RepID=A0A8S3RJJ1_MYTED|nr:KIF3A [Mytilus edulis]
MAAQMCCIHRKQHDENPTKDQDKNELKEPDLSNVYLAYTAEGAAEAMKPKASKSGRPKSSKPKSARPKSSKKKRDQSNLDELLHDGYRYRTTAYAESKLRMAFIITYTMLLTALLICLFSDSSYSSGKGLLSVAVDKHLHLPKITSTVTNIIYQLKTRKHRPICLKVAKVAKSCQDIYTENNLSPSGEYVIYPLRKAVRVYCSFEGDYGYTFISRKSSGVAFDIEKLYSTKTFAKVRLVTSKGEQREVKVENLLAFKGQSLTFELNGHQHYQGPQLRNSKLHPYLFLGFLPIKLVQKRSRQGYRAAGKDFTFKNCDANPNSYISFFFDPKHGRLGGQLFLPSKYCECNAVGLD